MSGDVATLDALVLDYAVESTVTSDRLRALQEPPKLSKVVALELRTTKAKRTA